MAFAFEKLIDYRPKGARFRCSNEILAGFNKPDQLVLAIVITDQNAAVIRFCRTPFDKQPGFKATSVNCALDKLLAYFKEPA